jgi:hypothetical protein
MAAYGAEQASAFRKSGVPVERVPIKPEELAAYCGDCGINPDGAGRSALAVSKVCRKKG